jgi:hypothetical protein
LQVAFVQYPGFPSHPKHIIDILEAPINKGYKTTAEKQEPNDPMSLRGGLKDQRGNLQFSFLIRNVNTNGEF